MRKVKHLVLEKKKKDQRHDTTVDDHHYDQSWAHMNMPSPSSMESSKKAFLFNM